MMNRREFLKQAAAACALLAVKPWAWVKAAAAKVAIPLNNVPDLKKVGGWKILKIKGREILFVRRSPDTVAGYCARCTHQNVLVEYDAENDRIRCPQHNSAFDMDGNVVKTPARKPLCTYATEVRDEVVELTIDAPEE